MSDAKSTPSHPLSGTQMRSKRGCHRRVSTEITARFPALSASICMTMPAPIKMQGLPANHSQSECQRCLQFIEHIPLSQLPGNESDARDTATWRDAQVNASALHFAFTQQGKCRHGVKRPFGMASR